MKHLYHLLLTSLLSGILCAALPSRITGQQTILYQDAVHDFEALVKEYDQGFYGRCIRSAELFSEQYGEPSFAGLRAEAKFYELKSALRLGRPGIQEEILAFSETTAPSPASQRALLLLGEDAYDRNLYDDAIKYLAKVDSRMITPEERSALYFKLGYCLFVRKEFDQAASLFDATRETRDKYYYPSNYYFGMTQYFAGNYAEAVRSFERVATSDYYKDYVPYYITQIHFTNKDYRKVIGYGNQAIASPSVRNMTELRHLVGQAYFETGDYAAALPHLAYVEAHSAKLRTEDFYQLGMAYYHTDQFQQAIAPFLQIRNEEGAMAHYANYYLGQCYLRLGDKTSARNALMNASRLTDVPELATEALFHYGKLSAEAGDDVEAIRVLQLIQPGNKDYQEAQQTLAGILTYTRDYNLAIRELEAMKSLSQTLKAAYQKVCLYRAEQLIQEGKTGEASVLLDKSLQYPEDKSFEARAAFWKSELAFNQSLYNESQRWLTRYFTAAASANDIPVHQSIPIAKYNQGYNELRLTKYADAFKSFEEAIKGLKAIPDIPGPTSSIKRQVLPDAVLRAGDAALKLHQYQTARQYYQQAIDQKLTGQDYAAYQMAIIQGLQNQPQEKVRLLEELVRTQPTSSWADDALFQIGVTWQDRQETAKALDAYSRLAQQYKTTSPLLLTTLLRLGLLNYNSGSFQEALKHYASVFEHNPDAETAREAMAAIREIYVNELDKPDAYFQFAATIPGFAVTDTEQDSISYLAAENHYALGQYDRAVQSFNKYLEEYARGLYALKARYLKAESLSLLKRYNEALGTYEEVVAQGNSHYYATSLYKAALIAYHQDKNFDKAYRYYTDYISVAESDEKAFEARLGALRSAFNLRKTDEIYQLASAIIHHQRSTPDHIAQAHYFVGYTAVENRDDDKALQAYETVTQYDNASLAAEARFRMAQIYERKGNDERAAELAEEAARANAGYPYWVAKSLILLSDVYSRQGDLLNARAILEAIAENFQDDANILNEVTDRLHKVKTAEDEQSRIKAPNANDRELELQPKVE